MALIQAITIEDHRYEQALRSVDFIKRYIFPAASSRRWRDAGRDLARSDLRLVTSRTSGRATH
jgi:cyclopropane-fatty-acyl-phospholipid synthase